MRSVSVALDAAHIQWHCAGGPDLELSGLALCPTHHKVFDRGAFTVNADLLILVSEHVADTGRGGDILLRFHGRAMDGSKSPEQKPDPEFLAWHRREVFEEKARALPPLEHA